MKRTRILKATLAPSSPIEVIDATGRVLLRKNTMAGRLVELDLAGYAPGLYRIRIAGTTEELGLSLVR